MAELEYSDKKGVKKYLFEFSQAKLSYYKDAKVCILKFFLILSSISDVMPPCFSFCMIIKLSEIGYIISHYHHVISSKVFISIF